MSQSKAVTSKTAKLEAEKKKRKRAKSSTPPPEKPAEDKDEVLVQSEPEEDEVLIAPRSPSPETKRKKAEVMKFTEEDLRRYKEKLVTMAGIQGKVPVRPRPQVLNPRLRSFTKSSSEPTSTTSGQPSSAKISTSAADTRTQISASDVPPLITQVVKDPEPVNTVPTPAALDVAADQAQIDLPQLGQETATRGGQGPSTSTAAGLLQVDPDIDWNGTPWEEDIFQDHEDLVAAKNATITLGETLHSLAERARARSDLCKQAAAAHLKTQKLEEDLQRVKTEVAEQVRRANEEAAKEKKKVEDELTVEKIKNKDVEKLLKSVCNDTLKKEQKLKDDLKEAEAAITTLKQEHKVATESEYYTAQKLAYEKQAQSDLEIDLVVAMQSLQNDQVAIAELEMEMSNFKSAAGYIMDMVVPQADEGEPKSLLDRLIAAPDRVTDLLNTSSKTAAISALVRVKSHYLEVEVAKIGAGPNKKADLKAIEVEVEAAADKVMEDIAFEEEEE